MTTLEVIKGGKPQALERVVAAAQRMEHHEEVDRWEFSEDVQEAVDSLSGAQNGFELVADGQRHVGFYAAIDEVNTALDKAGVISVGRQSIAGAYLTAKAWPDEERVEGATYWAHYELRGRDYDGRRQRVLSRLVAQNKKGRVGPREVRLWKSSQATTPVKPFLEQIESSVRSVLLRKGAPWNRLADDDRTAIEKILYRIANEVASGEFGR